MQMLSVTPNERVTFAIEYQDEDVLVINKRSGLATQPGLGHDTDTLLNGLFAHFGKQLQNLGDARDHGLLHRLDKATSGLLIVGLRPRAYDALRKQFEERKIGKFYWAICSKAPKQPVGMIKRPLLEVEPKRNNTGEKKTSRISPKGKPAFTAYRVMSQNVHGAVVEAKLLTGRLHQVRVHLESIGCPILGDTIYAADAVAMAAPRLALHAHRVQFTHPVSGKVIDVRSAPTRDFKSLLKKMGLPRPDLDLADAKAPKAIPADEPDEA